jgi:hypothetical protein
MMANVHVAGIILGRVYFGHLLLYFFLSSDSVLVEYFFLLEAIQLLEHEHGVKRSEAWLRVQYRRLGLSRRAHISSSVVTKLIQVCVAF